MSLSRAKLPLPVKGRSKTSSLTSGGMPRKEKIGETKEVNKFVSPLTLISATETIIATMYGKMLTTKSMAPLAPLTKMLYVFKFL